MTGAEFLTRYAAKIDRANGARGTDIADEFNITPQAVSLIVNRKAWRHVQ